MNLFSSLFQRNIRVLVWVVIALLALLPALALVLIGLGALEEGHTSVASMVQTAAIGGFAFCSILCGIVLLFHVADKVRDLTEQTTGLQMSNTTSHTAATPGLPTQQVSVQNELASLTVAISHIQAEFTSNLEKLHSQALFLENLERVLDNGSDMVVIIDDSNRLIYSNRAARDKLGVLTDSNIRHALTEGVLMIADTNRLADTLESWEHTDEELIFGRADGDTMVVHCIQTIVQLANQPRRKIVILRDVTDRKRMERQLYRSEQLAALGQLISGVAHELNNPLAAVLGFAELCHDDSIGREDLQRNLEIIEREASRTAHIVENLLNFSRQRPNRRGTTDIHELLERCFALLAYNFRSNNVTVRRTYCRDLPPIDVDEYQMQQVFMNLIINAAQAMRDANTTDPAITVETRIDAGNRTIHIALTDNGPGITKENLDRIFEPFFTTKKDDQGTGLGLPVSMAIVQNHKGELHVRSRVGSGTTFTIALPMGRAAACTDTPSPTTDGDGASQSRLSGRMLVLDDEPSILAMAKQLFESRGMEVSTACKLADALQLVKEDEFDVMVIDLCMPDGDGSKVWTLQRLLRPRCPPNAMFITGDPQLAAAVRKRVGPDVPILLKPFHVNELAATAERLLRHSKVRHSPTVA